MKNIVPVVLFLLILSGSVLLYLNSRKWECKEGKCELTLTGTYDTEEECVSKSSCELDDEKKVRFSETVEEIDDDDYSYICNSNYQCERVPGDDTGTYTTAESCLANCGAPTYYYSYPLYYGYRRPYYWGYGDRRWRPRVGRRLRHLRGDRTRGGRRGGRGGRR